MTIPYKRPTVGDTNRNATDWHPRSWPRGVRQGIALVAAAKIADVATTLLAMGTPGLEERNPVAVMGFETIGVYPTLIVGSIGVVLVVAGFTELGVWYLERRPDTPPWGVPLVRVTGYGLAAASTGYVAVRNVLLVVAPGVVV